MVILGRLHGIGKDNLPRDEFRDFLIDLDRFGAYPDEPPELAESAYHEPSEADRLWWADRRAREDAGAAIDAIVCPPEPDWSEQELAEFGVRVRPEGGGL